MENQVEQLKLNVTNIKSVLINSNAKLKKINSQKSSIVRTEAQKEKKAAAEKNIESVKVPGSGIIGGVVGRIKGIATSFFDKILNFAGYVLLGFIVTKLPEIIETGKKVYNFVKPIWDGVASTIKVIIKGAGFIVGGFQKAFSIFNPSKESTKIESMKKEIDKLDGELDVDDVPEEPVVTPTVQKDTSGSTSAPAPSSSAPVSSSPVKLPVIPFQKRNKGGSVTKTTQPNQEPWKYDESAVIKTNNLKNYPKVATRFTNNLLYFRKNISDFEKLMKSRAIFGSSGSYSGGGTTGHRNESFGGGSSIPFSKEISDDERAALGVLAKYESGAAGYNAVNQGGDKGGRGVLGFSGDIRNASWNPSKKPLTDMTVGEIKARQAEQSPRQSWAEWFAAGKLHAVGRYQFVGNTLPGVAARAGISDSAKFDETTQDRMAIQLIKERGISPWIGPSDKATAAERELVRKVQFGNTGGPDRYDFSSVNTRRLVSSEVKELHSMGKKKKTIVIPYEVKKVVMI